METPTNPAKLPPGHAQPGQNQGRTPSGIPGATPPVSTPFSQAHAAFSPHGPKSSPQQYKKSPANSATLMGHHGNPPMNFDSPSAAAAMGALGMSAGLDLGLDGVGVGSMGGLPMSTGEDDRIKRLDAIINILGNAKGLVSAAGLERLSLRAGLNKMWEEHRTPDGRTTQTLVMAGHGLQLDINLDNNIVQSVTVAFPESEAAPSVARHADKAGQILLRDLELLPNQSPLTKTLEKFAVNLERLATLDKLSVFPGLDCQEAIVGIYDSLEKLFQCELTKVRNDHDQAMAGKPEGLVEATVMCARSGRPGMHVRDQVGLSIDYWTERHLVFPRAPQSKFEEGPNVWSISVGCKPLDGDLYHAVRVSDAWLSNDVEKTKPTAEDLLTVADGPIIDWLEPDATTVPSTSDDKPGDLNLVQPDGKKLPNAKFVATFNPPLVVPQSVANSLYHLVGTQPPAMLTGYTFDGIFFPIPEGTNHDASEPRMISCKRDVLAKSPENIMAPVTHENMLFVYKPVYGQTITELPFSHPRQLVAMLPTLRQYALISTLLSRSFTSASVDMRPRTPGQALSMLRSQTLSDMFGEFADAEDATTGSPARAAGRWTGPLGLDVVLSVHPTAGLSVVFPFRDATANVELQIQQNGGIHVVSQNILPTGEEANGEAAPHVTEIGKKMRPQDLGRVLAQLEDLCSWAEWIRLNLS